MYVIINVKTGQPFIVVPTVELASWFCDQFTRHDFRWEAINVYDSKRALDQLILSQEMKKHGTETA